MPIKFSEIVAKFGGTPPHLLSEYHRGGSHVPATKQVTHYGIWSGWRYRQGWNVPWTYAYEGFYSGSSSR